jgi:hypothetical protein
VSPVKYELGFYIAEDDILKSHRRENLRSYKGADGPHSQEWSMKVWLQDQFSDLHIAVAFPVGQNTSEGP